MTSKPIHHPVFARMYARMSAGLEKKGAAEHRREMLEGLTGRVIEVGAGNGLNFSHYPATVTEVVAVEPESFLRDRAQQAAAGFEFEERRDFLFAPGWLEKPVAPHILGRARRPSTR